VSRNGITLNNSVVIPGKLAKLARPGIQENQKFLDARFRGYDGWDGRGFISANL
jgi:hypothetical protein